MAVTRINNNQITDASAGNIYLGINANTKLQNYSITSNKIANNLTYGSDLTVSGNLTVNGTSTAIDTTITTIEDPVIVLASTQVGNPTVDIGFLGERGSANNIAFVWNEANSEFVTAFTSTSETNTTISILAYANLHTNNMVVGGTTSLVGNIVGAVNATDTITGGNLATAGTVSATGDITGGNIATGGTVSATGTATVGNLATGGTVSATGTATAGNLATGGTVSATGTATVGNLATGGTISATGTATVGNVDTAGNVSATGNIAGSFFIGNGSQLTGVTASSANAETLTGTFLAPNVLNSSLVTVGNLTTLSVVGTTQSGNLQTAGLISATGNVDGGNINTIGTASATGNVTGGNIFTGGLISATGTVTGGNLETGGTANVTNTITGGNIQSNGFLSSVGTATVGNLATAGTVSATGTATAGNLATGGTVSATGNVDGGNINTGGTVSSSGNVTGGNILTGGIISATGNITGGNVDAAQLYGATALTLRAGTGNINLDTIGNVVMANTFVNGVAYPVQNQDAASKIYVDNLVSTGISYHEAVVATTNTTLETATGGTVTYSQPNGVANGIGATLTTTGSFNLIDTANVQTLGTRILVKDQANAVQNGVYVWANATAIVRALDADTYGAGNAFALSINDYFFTTNGNVNVGAAFIVDGPVGTITFGTSEITFAQFSSSQTYSANTAAGLSLVGQTFNAKVDNDTTAFDGLGNIIVKAGANLVTPNIGAATGTSLSTTGNITGGNLDTGGSVNATGTATVGNLATGGTVSATGTATAGNLATGGTVSATGTATLGNVDTGGTVSATGNVTGANFVTGGLISATGNVTGGNVLTGGLVSSTGTVTGGNLETGGTVSATGTATVGNLATGGTVSATGTATLGNVDTGGTVSAVGNVTGGNINTAGNVSATGNVTGAYLIGNIVGSITSPGANTDVIFNDNGTANATAGFTFNKTANAVTVLGTITGGNIDTGGTVSATGTATAGNLATGGTVSATGTATLGNVDTGGTVSATGNITGGNVLTGGLISATGNITTASTLQAGNIVISGDNITDTNGRVNFNIAEADVDFAVNGDIAANVFYIDAGTSTASFGDSTQTINSIVSFNATNSIKMPVGNTSQRPTGVTGQFRFNTTINTLEVYDNSAWVSVGQPDFTLITDQQFNGDGSTLVFTLSGNATTAGAIVSINGVQQIPTIAYAVSGTTLTFTEAPETGDLIDVRSLTTTTTVYGISNTVGNAAVAVQDGSNVVAVTGDLSVSGTIIGGNINSTAITFGNSNMTVVSSGGNIRANVAGTTVQTISAGLVAITGDLSVTGNATLSGNILGDRLQNGTSSIDIQTPSGNANITIGGTSNVAVFTASGVTITGDITNGAGNATGNIGSSTAYFNTVFAKATSAQYADLAEKYVADAAYAPGTVVVFGGTHEVTVNAVEGDRKVAGVVSTNPSYIMNAGLEGDHVATVALTGRVPTLVVGTVRKGDLMVAAGLGRARAEADPKVGTVIGKALEDFDGVEGTIEVVVGRF